MPIGGEPGSQVEQKISKEKVIRILLTISSRLDFMRRKIERYHLEGQKMSLVGPDEPDLTPEELSALWAAMKKFTPAMHEMDDLLTNIMNKDGKI